MPPPAETTTLIGPLILGGRFLGDIEARVDASGDGVVDVVRLAELLRPIVTPAVHEALAALAADGRFRGFRDASIKDLVVRFDTGALGVAVDLPAGLRPRSALTLGGLAPPRLEDYARPASAAGGVQFLARKTIRYDGESLGDGLEGRAEGFVTIGGFDGVTLTSAIDYLGQGRRRYALDGLTLTHDDFTRATRMQAGTVLPQPVGLQQSTEMRGFGFARRYQEIRPFQNIRPTGRQSLLLERPSAVDVYVNGALVQRLDLAPGPYDLDDFPLVQGGNDVRLVVRDGSGAEQVIDRAVFYSPVILAPGIVDFGGWIGAPRRRLGTGGRPLSASGYVLRGFGRTTLGANGQATTRGAQIGGSAVRSFGTSFVSADLAYGRRFDGPSGFALAVDARGEFSLRLPSDFRLNARVEARQRGFYGPVEDLALNPVAVQGALSASWQIDGRTTLTGGGSYARDRAGGDGWTASGGVIRRIGRASVGLYGQHGRPALGRAETSARLSLSLPLSSQSSATVQADSRRDRVEAEVARFRRSIGPDWTGRVIAGRQQDGTDVAGQAQWFGQRFHAAVAHASALPNDRTDGRAVHRTVIDASTFVGFAGDRVGWGREGTNGFTLVGVHPSLRKARASVQHYGQTMFRDDGLGLIVLPFSRGYAEVQQELVVADPPTGYALGETRQRLFPGFRSGYRMTVGTDAYLSVQGRLLRGDGQPGALLIGRLRPRRATMPTVDFFSTADGAFFAEGLAAGGYDVLIDGKPRAGFTVRPGQDPAVDLGEVRLDAD